MTPVLEIEDLHTEISETDLHRPPLRRIANQACSQPIRRVYAKPTASKPAVAAASI
jgi:hypothetical protein